MSIQGTKSTSGHKRQRQEDSLSEMAKRVCIKNSDVSIDKVQKILNNAEKQELNFSVPIARSQPAPLPEYLSVARMRSAEHTPEPYINPKDINPNKDIVSGIGLYQSEKDTLAYQRLATIINNYKSDFQKLVNHDPRRREIINQIIMEDLKDFNFVHKEYASPQKTNYGYRRLDKNNPKDKKIIQQIIKNRL